MAISFLAELGEQEIIDTDTAAKLDLARTEQGDDISPGRSPTPAWAVIRRVDEQQGISTYYDNLIRAELSEAF